MSFKEYRPLNAEAFIKAFGESLLVGRPEYPSTAPELPTEDEKPSDGMFYCTFCGKANTYWEVSCENCDMNINFMGGDQDD